MENGCEKILQIEITRSGRLNIVRWNELSFNYTTFLSVNNVPNVKDVFNEFLFSIWANSTFLEIRNEIRELEIFTLSD